MDPFDRRLIETARRVTKPELGTDELTLAFDNGVEIKYRRRVGDRWQVRVSVTVYVGEHFARLYESEATSEVHAFWRAANEKCYRDREESQQIALAGFQSLLPGTSSSRRSPGHRPAKPS